MAVATVVGVTTFFCVLVIAAAVVAVANRMPMSFCAEGRNKHKSFHIGVSVGGINIRPDSALEEAAAGAMLSSESTPDEQCK